MRIINRDVVYNTHDKNNKPSAYVELDESFLVKTELNGGTWLQNLEDEWEPGKSKGPNLSVCIYINGVKKGDIIAVDILDIKPEEIGYTGFAGWRNKLSQQIYPNEWDVVTKTVKIENNLIHWSEKLTLPIKPMIGTLGVAPENEVHSNYYAYQNGGNMDVQEVCQGTTVYFCAEVDGALLHVGDVHAIMGDGEINHGGGIECRSSTILKVRLAKSKIKSKWIRMENDEYIMAVACLQDMHEAFCESVRELIHYMCDDYGFLPQEAYLLLGQVLEARSTLVLGEEEKPKSYISKIKKKYLIKEDNFRNNKKNT